MNAATLRDDARPCLEDLAALLRSLDLPALGAPTRRPPRDDVRAVQRWVERALGSPDFVVDLLARDLHTRAARTAEPTGVPPFFGVPEVGVRCALAHWAPGRAAAPHEHSSWTVTAVVHNALEVQTFDWERSVAAGRVVPKHVFAAEQGRVGHIYEPCIHAPRNPTARASISLHVFAPQPCGLLDPREVEGLDGGPGEASAALPSPETPLTRFLRARAARGRLRATAAALAAQGTPRARALLASDASLRDATRTTTIDERTVLTRALDGIPLSVVLRGARAALVASGGDATFLTVDAWAAPALRFVAETPTFAVAQIPALAPPDRLGLARALTESGVLRPTHAGASDA